MSSTTTIKSIIENLSVQDKEKNDYVLENITKISIAELNGLMMSINIWITEVPTRRFNIVVNGELLIGYSNSVLNANVDLINSLARYQADEDDLVFLEEALTVLTNVRAVNWSFFNSYYDSLVDIESLSVETLILQSYGDLESFNDRIAELLAGTNLDLCKIIWFSRNYEQVNIEAISNTLLAVLDEGVAVDIYCHKDAKKEFEERLDEYSIVTFVEIA